MGMYDGPHFNVDKEKVTSVWVSIIAWEETAEV